MHTWQVITGPDKAEHNTDQRRMHLLRLGRRHCTTGTGTVNPPSQRAG
ncbi:hypothetical protein [Streptomyces sviceus]